MTSEDDARSFATLFPGDDTGGYAKAVTADKRAAQDVIAALITGKEQKKPATSRKIAWTQIGPVVGPIPQMS